MKAISPLSLPYPSLNQNRYPFTVELTETGLLSSDGHARVRIHALLATFCTIIECLLPLVHATCLRDYKYLSWVYGVDRKICHEGH